MVYKPGKASVCKYCECILTKEYEDIGICPNCIDVENDALDYMDELFDDEEPSYAGTWDLKQEDYY